MSEQTGWGERPQWGQNWGPPPGAVPPAGPVPPGEPGTAGPVPPGEPAFAGPVPPGSPAPPGYYGEQHTGYGAPPSYPGYGQPLRPQPGVIPLRPLSLGELYDGAVHSIRANPVTMIGTAALLVGLTSLLALLPQAWAMRDLGTLSDGDNVETMTDEEIVRRVAGAMGPFLVSAVAQWLALSVLTGVLMMAVSQAVLGRTTRPGQAWAAARPRLWRLLGLILVLAVLQSLALAVVGAVAGGLWWAGAEVASIVVLAVGIPAAIVLLAFLYVRWSMATPALMIEGQSVRGALRRSARITKGSFWRVLGILLLTSIVVGFASRIIAVPFGLVGSAVNSAAGNDDFSRLGVTLGTLLLEDVGTVLGLAVIQPFASAVTALLYVDLRMRREALDLELLRAAAASPR